MSVPDRYLKGKIEATYYDGWWVSLIDRFGTVVSFEDVLKDFDGKTVTIEIKVIDK